MSAHAELILAIDTSGAEAGMALAGDGRVDVALLASPQGGRARTEDLAAEASALLAARARAPRDLTLLAVVVGPGSYTGLRSGLAFVRGLAFADSVPVVAVGSLELLAWRGARAGESVVVASAAGAGRHTVAAYARDDETVRELAAPRILDDGDFTTFFASACDDHAALVMAAVVDAGRGPARAADPELSERAHGGSALVHAARCSGLDLRVPGAGALAQLAVLAAARSRRGGAVRAEDVLPIYVGLSSARPNRDRVAALHASE